MTSKYIYIILPIEHKYVMEISRYFNILKNYIYYLFNVFYLKYIYQKQREKI